MKLGDLEIDLIIKSIKAKEGAKEADDALKSVEASAKKASSAVGKLGSDFSGALNLTTIAATAVSAAFTYFAANAVKLGAELSNLRSAFAGTADDIELFRKATAGTVTEAGLLKISNMATDLGVSLRDQALALSLAEERADAYGGSIEDNFMSVVQASDGMERGLRSVGVAVQDYQAELGRLEKAAGRTVDQMDAQESRSIRLQAVFNLTGTTMETVANKQADMADVLGQMSIVAEEVTAAFGVGLVNGFNDSGKSANDLAADIRELKKAATSLGQTIYDVWEYLQQLAKFSQEVSYWLSPVSTALWGIADAAMAAYNWIRSLMGLRPGGEIGKAFNEAFGNMGTEPPAPGNNEEYGPGNWKGRAEYDYQRGLGNRGSRGSTVSKKKEQEDDLTYLARLKKELTDLQALMDRQTTSENMFSGLLEKKDDLERAIWLVENWKEVMAAPLPGAADVPGGQREGLVPMSFDDFMLRVREWRRERDEAEKSHARMLSDLQSAVSLAGEIAGKLGGGAKEFADYFQKALQLAVQIAQVTGKGGNAGLGDFLPILGTLFGFLPFSTGGRVPGAGSGDSIPAMLEPGEYVIRKSRAQQLGDRVLNWLNGGGPVLSRQIPAGAEGGDLVIQFAGEMTPEMKYKIVDGGSRFRNIRIANSTY